ncbi:aspartyl/asparaginyl beta-hydroxylase domain-containing protein [Algoriphagus halophytocola]|uniref:Aspartyl/asparaginyl beta-hydroxylase domain-containing protein n=1 Tax=Algoriphagus halophytocola TaxID=2991499 RepID=A0ABY6MKG2_9BACT|nr:MULTISPECIES: aspartyl/asparaginyl beta-hydroxylase domain-containing protein [unclassified Algoriphagus]UZD24138.1 aspartyl/asparaginyl beta-hydroxylase domain-containing protein [Algoriphagus sp. TR-M5]WBL41509.1 aspartyl/asparaginyl beta-hydroxylase domain-containing protein [Algoriphagus sp. TR-M9]
MNSFRDRVKLPFHFDGEQLAASLATLEQEYWVDHFVSQNYDGDWAVLPLTAQKGRVHPVLMASAVPGDGCFVPTLFLDKVPYIKGLLERFETKYQSVRMMRLGPLSEIKEHQDYDLDEDSVRIHVPVLTNTEVYFFLDQKRVLMQAGECWYLKLSKPHRVSNKSEFPRVHLVIDLVLNDWLRNLILQA